MAEILMINPSKRRRKKRTTRRRTTKKRTTTRRKTSVRRKPRTTRTLRTKSTGARTMARRRRRKTATKTTRRRRRVYRRNPSRTRRVARRSVAGLSFKRALKNIIALDLGMFSAKFAAKLWGTDATETDPASWNAMSYIKSSVGAVGAGLLINLIKPGMGQKVMEGGLAWTVFKAIENEVIAGNETATKWLGQDEYVYDGIGEDPNVLVLDEDETPYMTGADGQLLPLDESHRMLPEMSYGDVLTPVNRLGDALTTPGRLGDSRMAMLRAYQRDYV